MVWTCASGLTTGSRQLAEIVVSWLLFRDIMKGFFHLFTGGAWFCFLCDSPLFSHVLRNDICAAPFTKVRALLIRRNTSWTNPLTQYRSSSFCSFTQVYHQTGWVALSSTFTSYFVSFLVLSVRFYSFWHKRREDELIVRWKNKTFKIVLQIHQKMFFFFFYDFLMKTWI